MQGRAAEAPERRAEPNGGADLAAGLARAIERAQSRFLSLQSPRGYWHAPLEANVTMDAQYVFFNRFMRRERPDVERRLIEHLRDTQQAEGGWPLFAKGAGHLGVTVEAYTAMRLRGIDADEPALRLARRFVHERGGLERAGVFTKIFLAYFGEVPWSAIPTLPPELMLVPPGVTMLHHAFT